MTQLNPAGVAVGDILPEMHIEVTPTFVISTAIATRDFQDVHHDRDAALRRGSKDIFINILTDNGLVQRFITEWAGPRTVLRSMKIRLGVPCYAYETLVFSGAVTDVQETLVIVDVVGTNSLGKHLTGSVSVELPGGGA